MPETAATAPVTRCVVCHQPLAPWTNKYGVAQFVADDGWGSICGDAPRGMHAPVEYADELAAENARLRAALAEQAPPF